MEQSMNDIKHTALKLSIKSYTAIVSATVVGHADIVTKLMSEVNFKAPGYVGDMIELDAKVISVGKTSITVDCAVRNMTSGKEILKVDKVVYVSIYKDGSPKPH